MPVNKRSKFRGSRTCGGGTHKNRRGAGNRGGRGRAGHRDHRFTHFLLAGSIHNGKHGFFNQAAVPVSALSVGALDQMLPALLAEGIVMQEGDAFVIHAPGMGIDKVLGAGKVTKKMYISAKAFSEQAKLKIEALGGKAQVI